MNRILPLLFCFFISEIGFSQELISGSISNVDAYQKNIDVINFTTKNTTKTNELGQFTIQAKLNDILIFMSDNFVDQKYKLTQVDFEKKFLVITLSEKPIPLKEVEIQKMKKMKVANASYNNIRMAQIQKEAESPQNKDVYTGKMINGVDYWQIGKMVGKLFKSKNPKEIKEKPLPFKEYAEANFNQSFFSNKLQLNEEETPRFLAFCEEDPKSKTVMASNDELTMLEFLLTKKVAFDELK